MKSSVRWLLFEYKGRELVILSKPFNTKELAEKARQKYPEMHMRRRVPLLNIESLDTMFVKLRVAKPQLIFVHVVHFVAPIAVGRSAANYEWLYHKRSGGNL
jgi:hypothetical protein